MAVRQLSVAVDGAYDKQKGYFRGDPWTTYLENLPVEHRLLRQLGQVLRVRVLVEREIRLERAQLMVLKDSAHAFLPPLLGGVVVGVAQSWKHGIINGVRNG